MKKAETKKVVSSKLVQKSISFRDEDTAMESTYTRNGVSIFTKNGRRDFVFQNSKPDTIREVAHALLRIAEKGDSIVENENRFEIALIKNGKELTRF